MDKLPKYAVILQNDDINSLAKVILALNLITGMDIETAARLAVSVHEEGQAQVGTWHGEVAETVMKHLNDCGLTAIMEQQ